MTNARTNLTFVTARRSHRFPPARPVLSCLAAAGLLSGCALGQSGAQFRSAPMGSDLAMSADYRMVYNRARGDMPVLCAEPSPDIGRIVSAASSGNFTGSAKGLEKVQPELALAFAASRAEGLAQLGQRLATIQLLRDSTYRACEAYANQAISASTYAMIVSRYDDVMVTLLLAEMAAGAARPTSAALLSGTASTGGLSQITSESAVRLATARLEKATTSLDAAVTARGKLKADAPEAEKTAAQQQVSAAQREFDEATGLLKAALLAVGGTTASTTKGTGEDGAAAPASTVAQQLATMQKTYLDDFNLDAVTVGCLETLSSLDKRDTNEGVSHRIAARPVQTSGAATGALPGNDPPRRDDALSFVSRSPNGAYSLQDECRAILLDGQTLRAAAIARIDQLRAEQAARLARQSE